MNSVITCKNCNVVCSVDDKVCSGCGESLTNETASSTTFGDKFISKQINRALSTARKWLFGYAVLFGVIGTIHAYHLKSNGLDSDAFTIYLGTTLFLAGVMLVLFFLAAKFPFVAMAIALGFYLFICAIRAFSDPITVFDPIQIIFIGSMLAGLHAVKTKKDLERDTL